MAEQKTAPGLKLFLDDLFREQYAVAAIRYTEEPNGITDFILAGRIGESSSIEVRQRIGYKAVDYFICCQQAGEDGSYQCLVNDRAASTIRLGLQSMSIRDQASLRWWLRDDLVQWDLIEAERLADEIPDRFSLGRRYGFPLAHLG